MKPALYVCLLLPFLLHTNLTWGETKTLGRLFFSPEERASFDQRRRQNMHSPGETEEHFTLNGELQRKHGNPVYWGNGRRLPEGAKPPKNILVGDTTHGGTGKTEGIIRDGTITIRPSRNAQ